jgi:competence ComEA-like helix-hairpin-helix protein
MIAIERRDLIVSKNMDLNHATEQELTIIQGIGRDNAKKIVEHRLQMGSFKGWEDLKRIPGIAPHMLDTLKRHGFTVGGKAA